MKGSCYPLSQKSVPSLTYMKKHSPNKPGFQIFGPETAEKSWTLCFILRNLPTIETSQGPTGASFPACFPRLSTSQTPLSQFQKCREPWNSWKISKVDVICGSCKASKVCKASLSFLPKPKWGVSGNPLSTGHLDGRPLLDIYGGVGVGYREAAYTFGIQPHQTECRVFLNVTMGHFLGSLAPVYKASTCSLVLHLDSSPHLCPTS